MRNNNDNSAPFGVIRDRLIARPIGAGAGAGVFTAGAIAGGIPNGAGVVTAGAIAGGAPNGGGAGAGAGTDNQRSESPTNTYPINPYPDSFIASTPPAQNTIAVPNQQPNVAVQPNNNQPAPTSPNLSRASSVSSEPRSPQR